MEVKEMLFMNKGDGESSYAKSARLTEKVAAETQAILYKAVESVIKEISCTTSNSSAQVLNFADLGCAAGPNTYTVTSTVLESMIKSCSELGCQVPEIQFYFNDLVGNDFNTLFKGLSVVQEKYKNVSCFAMGAPGSFYGRLFPRNSMHLLHTSYGVCWLSKIPQIADGKGLPLNKGRIYISESTPPAVIKAYATHFAEDFLLFLKCRSQEMVPNGRIVLIVCAKKSDDPVGGESFYHWELLSKAISYLVSQGLTDEEKLDSFNAPNYNPSQEEIEELVTKEGSFTLEFIETLVIDLGGAWSSPELRARSLRSFSEPLISHQFGDKKVMDKLYDKVTQMLVEDGKMQKPDQGLKNVSLVAVLKRKDILT